jgi:cholesterol transport system auxiliary component
VVRMRATLTGNRNLLAQRSFTVEEQVKSPNAEGGVRALITASDAAILQLTDWLTASIK